MLRNRSIVKDDLITARTKYRNIIEKARKSFYMSKIMAASKERVFAISRWHKSTGHSRSTSLKNPRFPVPSLTISLSDKREFLIFNLLTNLDEAGDIPMNAPTAAMRSIMFPAFSSEGVQ